ncbi:MAG: aryl-sulfate sulfotransferase [Verrucomicrobia bacterium]|nr:aryl-sulfate sulfotransferase [Verrucomicrobiota bacterium]
MKITNLLLSSATALALLGTAAPKTSAAVPPNYPYVVVTNSGGAAPGNLIGTLGGGGPDGTRTYYVILDNTGTNLVFASTTNVLFRFVTPQGYATATDGSGFCFKDERLQIVDTFTTLGYGLDYHDVKLLPNGHALLLGAEVRVFDMSTVVAGGKVAAEAVGSVIQEIDANKRLVFEWHSLDHIAITNSFVDLTQQVLDYTHVNAVTIDPTDNNLLISFRCTSDIVKINRHTGQVVWRLGGKMNQFTFVNEHEENAPFYTIGQHDVHRLANGNLLYFDNGNITGAASWPSRNYSRVVEYALDEVNKIATLVWEYRHVPDIQADCQGSVKRMANGNTLIDWGCAAGLRAGTIVTEVNPAGQVVFEMTRRTTNGASPTGMRSSLTKQLWDSADLIRSTIHPDLREGQTYDSPQTGVSVTVNRLTGASNKTLVVQRHLDAVRFPKFNGSAPHVVMEHLVLSSTNVVTCETVLDLDLPDTNYVFDTPMIQDPTQVAVYQRAVPGKGQFSPLPTIFVAGTQKLRVTTTQLGEFIFAYPDVAEMPSVPLILSPADQSEVGQSQPVTLVWSARGVVGSFDLQLAADAGFSNLVLDTNGLGTGNLTLLSLLPNAQCFWRVRTVNPSGTSAWASASFTTVPPRLELTYPAGGEAWRRFQVVTIRWIDNLSEDVALDLYKGGVSNRTFSASTGNNGSYTWTVGQFADLPPGTDYTIKIRSTANPALMDFSEPFSIVRPVTLVTVPAGLSLTVDGTNYTAPVAFAWAPGSWHFIDTTTPQFSGDGHSRYLFASWSDSIYPSYSIAAPLEGVTNTARFSTNYLLEITVTPPAAATLVADPPGPWYASGELVTLSALPDADHLIYTWQGVDTQKGDTAQLIMHDYHAVVAEFISPSGVPAIQTDSFVILPDRRVQFTLTAGAGQVSQATVWGATTLTPPDWEVLATVQLNSGQAVFTDSTAPTVAARFYRVTLP